MVFCVGVHEVFDLLPDIFLADEDDEQEEASQHVKTINDPKEDSDEAVDLTRLTVMVMDDEMDALNDPEDTEDKEKFCVENLER